MITPIRPPAKPGLQIPRVPRDARLPTEPTEKEVSIMEKLLKLAWERLHGGQQQATVKPGKGKQ